jgi:hypothetical protein
LRERLGQKYLDFALTSPWCYYIMQFVMLYSTL